MHKIFGEVFGFLSHASGQTVKQTYTVLITILCSPPGKNNNQLLRKRISS